MQVTKHFSLRFDSSLLDVPLEVLEFYILHRLSTASLFSCMLTCSRLRKLASRLIDASRREYNNVIYEKHKYEPSERYIISQNQIILVDTFRDGSLTFLKWLQDHFHFPAWKEEEGDFIFRQGLKFAAQAGKFHMLKQLWRKSAVQKFCRVNSSLCDGAAEGGHLELMKWAHKNQCIWSAYTAGEAAYYGHFDLLKWMVENGCPVDWAVPVGASQAGRLNILKWAWENEFPFQSAAIRYAARYGHLHVLKWFQEDLGISVEDLLIKPAAEGGQLEVLKWAREIGCQWEEDGILPAVRFGHLELLKWAHANGCPMTAKKLYAGAVFSGHLEVIKWLYESGFKMGPGLCTNAAGAGHLEVLKWVRAHGCEWDENTAEAAAQDGELEILQWLIENGCPWNERTCTMAVTFGHLKVLKWARENNCPCDAKICLLSAAVYNQFDILKWLLANGAKWTKALCKDLAPYSCYESKKWISENVCRCRPRCNSNYT